MADVKARFAPVYASAPLEVTIVGDVDLDGLDEVEEAATRTLGLAAGAARARRTPSAARSSRPPRACA